MLAFLSFLFKGPLSRALDTVDRRIDAQTDKEKIKADIIQTHIKSQSGFLEAGGFWLIFIGGLPAVFHAGAVYIYSVLWCSTCAFPKDWSIAALPTVYAQHQEIIILTWMGGLGLMGALRRIR